MEERTSILIIDGNVGLCRGMSFVLGRQGYAVTIAEREPEAIEKVKEQPFDMILIDIEMAFAGDVEAYRIIRQIRPQARVMMMAATAAQNLVQEALKEGVDGVVYKPLDTEGVVAAIEETRGPA